MMLRKRSNPWAQLKYLCIIVLTLFSVIAFARPEVANKLKGISTDKLGKFIKKQVTAIAAAAKAEKPTAPEKKTVKANEPPAVRRSAIVVAAPVLDVQDVKSGSSPLCIVNGKETSYAEFESIIPETIKSVKVLKEKEAIAAYGDKGKNGAIEITLNSYNVTAADVLKIIKQGGVVSSNGSEITAADVAAWAKKQPANVTQEMVINNATSTFKEPSYVFFIGGKMVSMEQQALLSANKEMLFKNDSDAIESTISLTGKAATDKYGPQSKNVIEIYLKAYNNIKK